VPVTATVDLTALRHNVRVLQQRADGADLMAIVKADAYGHGAERVAHTLFEEGVRHFAVARPTEGVQLRRAGLPGRILVLGAPFPDQLSVYAEHNLDLTVPSLETARAVHRTAGPATPLRVHVAADTGMGRIGLSPGEVPSVVQALDDATGVTLAGVWTHLATADEPRSPQARAQLDRFDDLLGQLEATPEHVHVGNTGALLTVEDRVATGPNRLLRTGIALYGYAATPSLDEQITLHPVMQLRARVTHVKTVPAGTSISYGATWTASQRCRIATLGVGYGDGYPRLGSGQAQVRIDGRVRPVVGTICMDMCMVNLGPPDHPAAAVEVGDEAILFGPQGPTLFDVADWAHTIPYEICCGISPRVPRHYTDAEEGHAPQSDTAPAHPASTS